MGTGSNRQNQSHIIVMVARPSYNLHFHKCTNVTSPLVTTYRRLCLQQLFGLPKVCCMTRTGLEPVTLWLKVRCSTNWANESKNWDGWYRTNDQGVKVLCLTTWLHPIKLPELELSSWNEKLPKSFRWSTNCKYWLEGSIWDRMSCRFWLMLLL